MIKKKELEKFVQRVVECCDIKEVYKEGKKYPNDVDFYSAIMDYVSYRAEQDNKKEGYE